MAKKKVSKKSAGKKTKKVGKKKITLKKAKAGGGGGPDPLCDRLTTDVTDALLHWQINFGRAGIRQLMLDMLKPSTAHTTFLQWMVARSTTYHSMITDAKTAGETYPWVIPWVGAVSFESMFQACAGFWLAAGDPPAVDQLRPSVVNFIDFQVGLFCTTVGAT